jgi:hypothetical protein
MEDGAIMGGMEISLNSPLFDVKSHLEHPVSAYYGPDGFDTKPRTLWIPTSMDQSG